MRVLKCGLGKWDEAGSMVLFGVVERARSLEWMVVGGGRQWEAVGVGIWVG